jgi:Terpene synthase family 2, C-terminal metal binding
MTTSFTLPRIVYPFGADALSSHVDAVERSTLQWAAEQALFSERRSSDYNQIRVGYLAGLVHPNGTLEGLSLIGKWLLWLFAFDDRFSDESAFGFAPVESILLVARLLAVLDDAPHGGAADPFEIALADFMQQLDARATPAQRGRFVGTVSGYFHAFIWEAVNRARSTYPTVESYEHMRGHGGAVPTCIALIDTVNSFVLPAEDYHHPEMARLTQLASNLVCWSNDILSYPKEVARNGIVHSLPTILQHHHKIDIRQALSVAVAMHDREVITYTALEHQIRSRATPELSRFLDDMRSWVAGNVKWSLSCRRYIDCLPAPTTDRMADVALFQHA